MKNSPQLNVWILICLPVLGSMVSCVQKPCEDRLTQGPEELVKVKTTVEYSDVWQASLAEKVSDLIGFVENTWQHEARVDRILKGEGTSIQVILPELKEADMSITFARRRVMEIADLIQHLELTPVASDRMRDRLRKLDGFLMKKEVYFNRLKTRLEENPDVSFISQTKPIVKSPRFLEISDMDHFEAELNGLQQDLYSTQSQVKDQQGMLESFQSVVDSQEILRWEMKQAIRMKDLALDQSDEYKEKLRKDIHSLENQRLQLKKDLESLQIETKRAKAEIYLQTANELFLEMGEIKGKKNRQSIGKLALDFYEKAKACECLSDTPTDRISELEVALSKK